MRRIKRLQQRNSSITRGRNRTEATKTAATPNRYKSALGHRKTTPTACSLLYRSSKVVGDKSRHGPLQGM